VTIISPVAEDPNWRPRAGEGFEKASFIVDSVSRVVSMSRPIWTRRATGRKIRTGHCSRPAAEEGDAEHRRADFDLR
jgi:hypothetical protein